MKHLRKIMMLILTVIFIAGCGAPKADKEADPEVESLDIEKDYATSKKRYAYTLANLNLTILDVFNNGGDRYQCIDLLKSNYEDFEKLKEDEALSEDDHLIMFALYLNTSELAKKVADSDHDTDELEGNINKCIENLKKGENWEEW